MKKIYNTLFAVAALLAFAPAVFAQTPGEWSIKGQINETVDGVVKYLEWPKAAENGLQTPDNADFAYSKDISAPQSDGTYWIKLESFATGAASTILSSTPSDIILVLDSSTSMNTRDYNTGSGTVTRIQALREATNLFIDNIYQNDADVTAVDPNFPGNRIAIVSYDASAHLLTSGWVDVGSSGAVATLKRAVNNMSLANWTRPDLGMSSAITNFLSGSTDASRKRADANLTVVMFTDGVPCHNEGSGNTFQAVDANAAIFQGHRLKSDFGATLYTVGLLNINSTDNNIKCGRYFLDLLSSNYPQSNIAQNSTSAWNVNGDNITINGMTIGEKDTEGNYFRLVDAETNLKDIFDSISKQSGGSSSQLSASSRNVDVVSNSFIIPGATQQNIGSKVKIFIAKVSGYDATKKEITFYEEIMTGHIPNEPVSDRTGYYYYPLDEDGDIPDDAVLTKVDASLGLSYNATTQAVTVTGFDYSSNFCGPIYRSNYQPSQGPEMTEQDLANVDHWQGYKIIIMIPIKMNPDAVGGPDVPTNATGSGIYIGNTEGEGALVQFKSPNVSLPVNIHLKKTGLGPGESAKFRIERALLPDPIPEGFDPATLEEWSYVSTVFVTRPQGAADSDPDPIVKVRGLPANMDVTEGEGDDAVTTHQSFVYRVTEEDWSWSYTPDTPPQYTTTSNVTNPFTFSNTKEDNIDVKVRHAESKATNVFVTGSTVKYDDSKTNNR
jgi:hypothetical protein